MVLPTSQKNSKVATIFIGAICLFFQILPVFRSGLLSQYGIGFWGPNGHDGIWHLSLINNIKNPLSIHHPSISGEALQNYHPFFDIIVNLLSRLSHIDPSIWLFQIMPVVTSLLFIYLTYKLAQKLYPGQLYARILIFLNCFATSFGWVISLLRNGDFYGESIFWSMQSFSNQLNPPFILSLVFILGLILVLVDKRLQTSKPLQLLLIFLTAFLPITKAYAAVAWFVIFFFYSALKLSQKNTLYLKLLVISLIPSVLLFYLYNHDSTSLFEFNPLWFVHSMFQSTDHLYLPKVASFQYNQWLAQRVFTPKYLLVELVGITLFIVGNFSWRLLGLTQLKNIIKNPLRLSVLAAIVVCLLIPLVLVQKGTPWNTIQFVYYSLFLSNIFLAEFLHKLSPSLKGRVVLSIILISIILGNIGSIQTYIGNPPPTAITPSEIKALSFLKSLPNGIVLTYPYDAYQRNLFSHTPIPIYAYETTSYVPAYSSKVTYLSDEMNLSISGYDWQSRRDKSIAFFEQKNPFQDRGFLINNQISYLFLDGKKANSITFHPTMSLRQIYISDEVSIYQVNR